MIELDIKPSEALPILDHGPNESLEKAATSGKWHKVPRAEVMEIPPDHPARINIRATYIVSKGHKRRSTAMKHGLPYRVNVLEEADLPDYKEQLESLLQTASSYYYDLF